MVQQLDMALLIRVIAFEKVKCIRDKMKKDKKAKYIMGFLCIGMLLGSALTLMFDNIYLLTIFTGIGSSIGLVYVNIKNKK